MNSYINYEKDIISSREFINLLSEENPITVFNRITYIVKKYTKHNNLGISYVHSMTDILFIYYMRILKARCKNEHFYEDMYLKMCQNMTPVLESFFISLKLDLSYIGYNRFGLETPLADALAIYTKDSENMKLVIKKLSGLARFSYSLPEENLSTDICQMSIRADELTEAFKIFSTIKYRVFPAQIQENNITINTDANPSDEDYNKDIVIENVNNGDILYSIIKTLESARIRGNKELFLSNVLCSGKYQLFNVACLPLIRSIVGRELYDGYLEYIISLAETGKIALYKMEQKFESNSSVTISYVSPESIAKDRKNKTIVIEPKKEIGA